MDVLHFDGDREVVHISDAGISTKLLHTTIYIPST